jgi:hypothetical protein
MTRPIEPLSLPGALPGVSPTALPEFVWVQPTALVVDEGYQRDLSRKSLDLITKIVSRWDWARFKPPIVAAAEDGSFEVIDGQHTAIAAASHPSIELIPVMLVRAASQADRARAFVGHNRDRLQLSQVQIHIADVAAGDEDAQTVQQVCDRAGVNLCRYPPGNGEWAAGDSLAIAAIRALINRRGAMRARIVLQALVEARCAPVRADGIKAVEALLHNDDYKGEVTAEDIATALIKLGPTADQEAHVFAAAHKVPMWRALAVTLFKEARRGRRRAA